MKGKRTKKSPRKNQKTATVGTGRKMGIESWGTPGEGGRKGARKREREGNGFAPSSSVTSTYFHPKKGRGRTCRSEEKKALSTVSLKKSARWGESVLGKHRAEKQEK